MNFKCYVYWFMFTLLRRWKKMSRPKKTCTYTDQMQLQTTNDDDSNKPVTNRRSSTIIPHTHVYCLNCEWFINFLFACFQHTINTILQTYMIPTRRVWYLFPFKFLLKYHLYYRITAVSTIGAIDVELRPSNKKSIS